MHGDLAGASVSRGRIAAALYPPAVLDAATSWCRARGPVTRAFGAFLLFLTTSILVFALPVMPHLASRCVASCLSDTALYAWSFDYMAHVVTAGFDPLHATVVWAPGGVDLAWVTTLTGPALLMTPFTTWIDPIFSVNVLMLLAPALAAWATYLVCVRVTQRFWPSVMGGFVFGFSTYLSQHMRAHLNLVLIFFLPLAVYLVLRRVQRDIAPWVFVLLLGIDIAAQFTVSTELAATTAMFGGIASDRRVRLRWSRPPRSDRAHDVVDRAFLRAGRVAARADPRVRVPTSAARCLPRPDAELRRRLEHRGPAAHRAVRR